MHLSDLKPRIPSRPGGQRTCMADTSIEDLDSDFVGFWRGDLDVFDRKVLAGLPGNGSLLMVRC